MALFTIITTLLLIKNSDLPQHKRQKKATPETALLLLKSQFESGAISQEEYTAQRLDIIRKL